MKELNPETLESASGQEVEKHLKLPSELWLPAEPGNGEASQEWLEKVREFHLTGELSDSGPVTGADRWLPAVLVGLEKAGKLAESFPYFLPEMDARDESPASLLSLLKEVVSLAGKSGTDFSILQNNLGYVAALVAEAAGPEIGIGEAFKRALKSAETAFDLSSAGQEKLQAELKALSEFLPAEGMLTGFDSRAWLRFYLWVAEVNRASNRKDLIHKVRELKIGIDTKLAANRARSADGRSAAAVASSIGDGAAFLDPTALSKLIPKSGGSIGLSAERRKRLEEVSDILSRFSGEINSQPTLILVHSEANPELDSCTSCKVLTEGDPYAAAMNSAREIYDGMVEVFKAMRVAELEVADEYDETLHGKVLKRFSWGSCTAEELLALPQILVYESAERLAEQNFGSFNRLIRSGLPVHIVLTTQETVIGANASEDALGQYLPDFGYLAIAQREAFVLQSSLARPDELLEAFDSLFKTLLPAVAIIALPAGEGSRQLAWWRSAVAVLSRSFPSFTYKPDRGNTWAERFSLAGNEEPGSLWLTQSVSARDQKGRSSSISERLSFAHVAALDSRFRRHFLPLPQEASSDELIELTQYLDEFVQTPPEKVPYIWVVDESGVLVKAIMTREMVNACRDRARAWRSLQELAGLNNAYVEAAVKAVREEMEREAQQDLSATIEAARKKGAEEAVERLVAVLTNPSAALAGLAQTPSIVASVLQEEPLSGASDAGVQPEPEAVAAVAVEAEEEELAEEAFIDSFLCSSCNDCINLNPLMFKYNGDKQAEIADLSAGTYAQLVKAAEGCPAGCIHPGLPRPGDETATPEVIARAKAFR